jgi:hypothetical protein
MARNYGSTVGLAKEDIICVPAARAFGFSDAKAPSLSLAGLFCEVGFSDGDCCSVIKIFLSQIFHALLGLFTLDLRVHFPLRSLNF